MCNYRGEIARWAIMSDSCFSHASLNHGRGEEWPVEELVDAGDRGGWDKVRVGGERNSIEIFRSRSNLIPLDRG